MIRALRQLFSSEASEAGPGQAPLAPDEAGRLMKLATVASVSVATVLIGVKLAAWLMTDSISVLSSLVDSLLDVLASLVNMFAVYHALRPADREHRFGHGKAEPLAGLGQVAFISVSAVLLLIFRDTILSFVASIQITNNDMVHVGDWIEMPKYGADGDVVDVLSADSTTFQPNLFYHPQAFSLASVKLPKLFSTDTTVTTEDGFSLRVSKYADGDANVQKVRFDLLPAFAVLNPFFAGHGYGVA